MDIVTHNARFHADDVFAAATILELHPRAHLKRTREQSIIDAADIVFDVGNVYDVDKMRFDHHQAGGAGKRANDIPYASFGLVWKKFGEELCGSKVVAEAVDRKLVQAIDAMDNGIDLSDPRIEGLYPYTIQSITFTFGATWKEDPELNDTEFMELVGFARKILKREIKQAQDFLEAEKHVKAAYDEADDKRIIVLDNNYPWQSILTLFSEPLYVVRPNVQTKDWKVEAVPVKIMNYENRKKLPESWAGKRDKELAEVTGVPDAHFCHNGRFLAIARSKDGALKLAKIAVVA